MECEILASWPAEVVEFAATAAGRSFAHAPAFRRAVERTLPGWAPRLLAVRDPADGGRVAGVLGGYLERRAGGTWFRGLPFGTPAGPLFDAALAARGDVALAPVAGALWEGIADLARSEGWLGGDVTLSGPAARSALLRPAKEAFAVRFDDAHVIDLAAGLPAWRAALSNAARRMFAQAERRGVTIAESADPDDLAQVHALHVAQAKGWGARGVRPLAFYRALCEPPTTARLWVARREGRIVCGILGFVEPFETYAWWSGAAPESRALRAYPATIAHIAEACGSARLNLGFSGGQSRLTDFKEQLGAVRLATPIVELASHPRTPFHALLVTARRFARGLRSRA